MAAGGKLLRQGGADVSGADDSDLHGMSFRQVGSPFCFRRLLSNADSGTKRRRVLTRRASFPAA